jgi:xanthine dehydrogenase accessory factor
MSDHVKLWDEAGRLAAAGTPAAVATVARQRGSLPMASDAKMLVTREGRRAGTVGGGSVEADVIGQALETLQSGRPMLVQHTLNASVAGELGLSCGGTVELFVEPLVTCGEMAELCAGVSRGIREREVVTVCTGLDWSGGPAKAAWIGDRMVAVGRGVSRSLHPDAFTARGRAPTLVDRSRSLFVERLVRIPRVIIFGAGHVGAAIARVAAEAGFYVVVTDDRSEFANQERLPAADEVIVGDIHEVLDGLVLDEDDYVLATTRGHNYDAEIVGRTASSRARYVGMLGSRRKRALIWQKLAEAGVPEKDLNRVRSPIGLHIGGESPGEIAVSVAAELIRARRQPEATE